MPTRVTLGSEAPWRSSGADKNVDRAFFESLKRLLQCVFSSHRISVHPSNPRFWERGA